MIKIPKEFELANQTIIVELKKSFCNETNNIGFTDYVMDKIILDDSDFWKKRQEECFFHELVHWILFKMSNDLEKDEKFVGLFGSLLHQAFKTMKYTEVDGE